MTSTIEAQYFDFCPECSGMIQQISLNKICSHCGLILYEYPNFKDQVDFKKERIQSSYVDSVYDFNLAQNTVILKKEAENTPLKRLYILNKWSYTNKNRILKKVLIDIKRISANLHLPIYINRSAFLLFRKLYKDNSFLGKTVLMISSALILYTCRFFEIPITIQELAEQTQFTRHNIYFYLKFLVKEMKLTVKPLNIVSYLIKFAHKLQFSQTFINESLKILKSINSQYTSGKNPKGIIGAILYMISKKTLNISQKEICTLTEISEVSLRSRIREIKTILYS